MVIFSRSTKRTKTQTKLFLACPQRVRALSPSSYLSLCMLSESLLAQRHVRLHFRFRAVKQRKFAGTEQSPLDNSHKWATFRNKLREEREGRGEEDNALIPFALDFISHAQQQQQAGRQGGGQGILNWVRQGQEEPCPTLAAYCVENVSFCSVFRVDLCANNPAAFSRKCQTHSKDKLSCFLASLRWVGGSSVGREWGRGQNQI